MKTEDQQTLFRDFLLGALPESKADALETELLANDDRFEQVWETENQLVDDYVRGQLPQIERETFERHYLTSPLHVQRVAFARKLIAEADELQTEAVASPIKERRPGLWARMDFRTHAWGYAFVAALLLFAGVTAWLLLERSRLRSELAQIQQESRSQQTQQRELESQITAAREQGAKLSSELEQLRTEHSAASLPSPSPNQPSKSVFSFVLSSTLVRGSDNPPTLTIPANTDVVRLQMYLGQLKLQRYRIDLRTVEGRQVLTQQISGGKGSVVTAEIPANKLSHGDYIVTLSGTNGEEVNRYFLRVNAP